MDELHAHVRQNLEKACGKPGSAKRIHSARRSLARLESAQADRNGLISGLEDAELHRVHQRAGKVRDADVLAKIVCDYAADASSEEDVEATVALDNLRWIRKRAVRKFLKESKKILIQRPEPVLSTVEAIPQDDSNSWTIKVRYAQVLQKSTALRTSEDANLHEFRLACKRLRYALERSGAQSLGLSDAVQVLRSLAKELGVAHDLAVLARKCTQWGCGSLARKALRDRPAHVRTAKRIWRSAFLERGGFCSLNRYAGWSV